MVLETDLAFLSELEPVAEKLLNRHFEKTKEWHPHALVPWSRGEDFEPGYEWSPEEAALPAEVRSALFVNLLTEDNLPYYFRDIERMFGRDGAWGVLGQAMDSRRGSSRHCHSRLPHGHSSH